MSYYFKQIMLFVGVIMMVMGTYANLYAMEEISTTLVHLERIQLLPINPVIEVQPLINDARDKYMIDIKKGKIVKNPEVLKMAVEMVTGVPIIIMRPETIQEVRREPPQSVVPYDEEQFEKDIKAPKLEEKLPNKGISPPENVTEVDKVAIEKEDNELREQEKINKRNEDKKADDFIATLEKHKEEQTVLIQQQQKLLEEIKKETKELQDKHLEDTEKDKEIRSKASNQIVEIAKKALEILNPKNENIKNTEEIIEKLSQNNTKEKYPSKENLVEENKTKLVSHSKLVPENTFVTKDLNLSMSTQKKLIPLPMLVNIRKNSPKLEVPTVNLIKIINDPQKNTKNMEEVKNYNLKSDNEVVKEIQLIGRGSRIEKIITEKPELDKNAGDWYKEEQKVLIQQRQELLEEIKKETKELQDKHLEDIEKDKEIRSKASNHIVEIAKKALEMLVSKKL